MTTFLGYYDNSKKLNLDNIVLLIVYKNQMQKTIYFVSTMIILLFYLLKLMINVLMHNASLQNFLQISSNIFLRFGKCAFLLTMPVKVVSKLLLDRSLNLKMRSIIRPSYASIKHFSTLGPINKLCLNS